MLSGDHNKRYKFNISGLLNTKTSSFVRVEYGDEISTSDLERMGTERERESQ